MAYSSNEGKRQFSAAVYKIIMNTHLEIICISVLVNWYQLRSPNAVYSID